ncbi:Phosphatidylinositol/phosphatidylcholine transfer protein SFH2-like protein [Drosera capensis]
MEGKTSSWNRYSKLSTSVSRTYPCENFPVPNTRKDHKCVASKDFMVFGSGIAGDAALFLLKMAALETIRRFSRARCPLAWKGVQALQAFCYPPFKWIHKWMPFKGLLKAVKAFSRPFLVLSVATALSDHQAETGPTRGPLDSRPPSGGDSESSSVHSSVSTGSSDEAPDQVPSDHWVQNLLKEFENQGISLPERIKNELPRYYLAADGNLSSLLAAVKKSIRWRETYYFLSQEELQLWSNMVFWHGYDVLHQPCLVVRLGLAINLPPEEGPWFTQAIVSQVEYGMLNLIGGRNPQMAVLIDCERLPPLKIPLQMMRSCCAIFQEHYPDRLGSMFVIRLPPVLRVLAQTFIQILKPVTRQRLKFLGQKYQDVLLEHLQALPAYLGGKCSCSICSSHSVHDKLDLHTTIAMASEMVEEAIVSDNEDLPAVDPQPRMNLNLDRHFEQIKGRDAAVEDVSGTLMIVLAATLRSEVEHSRR